MMQGPNSMGLWFMAVFAVSGSVVLVARQLHKRLLSDFMKKIECEMLGSRKCKEKKRVRFADDVMEPSTNNKEYRKRSLAKRGRKIGQQQPVNRQILYQGMIQSQNCL